MKNFENHQTNLQLTHKSVTWLPHYPLILFSLYWSYKFPIFPLKILFPHTTIQIILTLICFSCGCTNIEFFPSKLMKNVNSDKLFNKIQWLWIYNIPKIQCSINSSKFITYFVKYHARQYDTNHISWAKALGNQVLGDKKEKWIGQKYIRQLINSEAMTSQTDNQIGNYFV